MYYSLLSLKMISFVLFPQTSQPRMNFSISELVCYTRHMGTVLTCLENYTWHVPILTRKNKVRSTWSECSTLLRYIGKGCVKFSLWFTSIFKSVWKKNLHFFTNRFSFIPGSPYNVVTFFQIFEELPGSFRGKARFFTRQVCILLTTLI